MYVTIDDLKKNFDVTKNENYYLLLHKKWDYTIKNKQKNTLATFGNILWVLIGI